MAYICDQDNFLLLDAWIKQDYVPNLSTVRSPYKYSFLTARTPSISLTEKVLLYNSWRIRVENLLSVDMLFPKERIKEMTENRFCFFKLSDKIKLVFPPWKGGKWGQN